MSDRGLAEWIERWSGGAVPAEQALALMTQIAAGPECVWDVSRDGRRVAAAILVDTCASEANTAELTLLALAPDGPESDRILDAAVERIRLGPRGAIDVPRFGSGSPSEEWLEERGFAHAFSMFHMIREKGLPLTEPTLTPPLRWSSYEPRFFESYYDVLKRAFRHVPGAFVPDEATSRKRIEALPVPAELILEGDRAIAFVRVERRHSGGGDLTILGRDPGRRGERLGEALVARGLSRLRSFGAEPVYLDVAATNRDALRLYERFFFSVTQETKVFRLPVSRR